MQTHRECILLLRVMNVAMRLFLPVRDDPVIAHAASNRPQLRHRMVALTDNGGWPAHPPQHNVGGAA